MRTWSVRSWEGQQFRGSCGPRLLGWVVNDCAGHCGLRGSDFRTCPLRASCRVSPQRWGLSPLVSGQSAVGPGPGFGFSQVDCCLYRRPAPIFLEIKPVCSVWEEGEGLSSEAFAAIPRCVWLAGSPLFLASVRLRSSWSGPQLPSGGPAALLCSS